MKRLVRMVRPLLALTLCALPSAACADKVGLFLLGGQYEQDLGDQGSVRYGLGLPLAFASGDGGLLILTGDVSYLRHTTQLGGLQPYYGGGLGLLALFASAGGSGGALFGVYPNVLGGVDIPVNTRLDAFVEASAGPRLFFAPASSSLDLTFGIGARLGFNYRLP